MRRESRLRQAGQALVEGVLVALLLVPLLTGAWLLASLSDLQSQIISAARLVAVQRASIPMEARVASHSKIVKSLFDLAAERARFWRDPILYDPWFEDSSVVQVRSIPQPLPTSIDRVTNAALATARSMRTLSGSPIDLAPSTYAIADIALNLNISRLWKVRQSITFREQLLVLENGWAADIRDDVERRVLAISATNTVRNVADLIRPFEPLLRPIEPSIDTWCPGWIDVEIVPSDRLDTQASNPKLTRSRQRC